MSGQPVTSNFYVAPPEPPPSRRPPITSVGPLGWLRTNLFSSPLNTIATLITGVVVIWFLWSFLVWSIGSAQWGVVFNNLRLVTSGLYDRNQIWRVELTAAVLVFLTGLGLGIWARVARGVFLAVVAIVGVMLIIPVLGARIPDPTLHVLIEPQRTPSAFVFAGRSGQDVFFELIAQTDRRDADQALIGYLESTSRTEWSTQSRSIREGTLDPSEYNLDITLTLNNKTGRPLASIHVPADIDDSDRPAGRLAYTLPADGWYVLHIERDDEINGDRDNNQGYAWLMIDGVRLFSSQQSPTQAREKEFGPPPVVTRPLYAEEKAYRFEGIRTFSEFISLQIAPFFSRIVVPLGLGALLFFVGWVIGTLGKREQLVRRGALAGWVLAFPVLLIILHGFQGSRVLPLISTSQWGGLLLTILLTFVGITASFPLGVALALGRRSDLPMIKWTCTLLIETIRGVPLITILFMAKLIVPFFWAGLSTMDLTIRMMIGLTLFSAAYLAENVRGGLQIIPHGQIEAARALGMNPLLTTVLIVLPQALRAVIPAIVGQFISLFKDTSLVAIVGLFELVGIVDTIVSGQPIYRPYQREAYIFIALIYFVISYAMSDVSRRLEASGAGSIRRA